MTRDLYMIITAALVYISYLSNFIVIYELCYGVASGTTATRRVVHDGAAEGDDDGVGQGQFNS